MISSSFSMPSLDESFWKSCLYCKIASSALVRGHVWRGFSFVASSRLHFEVVTLAFHIHSTSNHLVKKIKISKNVLPRETRSYEQLNVKFTKLLPDKLNLSKSHIDWWCLLKITKKMYQYGCSKSARTSLSLASTGLNYDYARL